MTITRILISLTTIVSVLVSCQSDDDNLGAEAPVTPVSPTESDPTAPVLEKRIIVSHEGSSVSGSTSVVSLDLKTVTNKFYDSVNEEELGVFQQSIGFNEDKAYIVVDNQNTITVVDKVSFVKETAITEMLKTPRYIDFKNGKAYVTNWGVPEVATDDFVAIIDLASNKVESTIAVAEGPDQILVVGNKLYISHKGGFEINNRLSIIDLNTKVLKEIETPFLPDEMVFIGNDLWVSCEGIPAWRTEGESISALIKIDTTTDTIVSTLELPLGQHTSQMTSENGIIYYTIGKEIFEFDITATSLPTTAIAENSIYGMQVNDGIIYTVDAKDFASGGTLNAYTISTKTWSAPVSVGVVPAKIYIE